MREPGDDERGSWEGVGRAMLRFTRSLETDPAASGAERAQALRYAADLLAAGIVVCVEHADPLAPVLARMIDHTMKWGLDAPDCLYLYATIRGDCRYRISGRRGSAHHIDIQANWGHYAEGDIDKWGTISSINSNQLDIDDDGSFQLSIGGPAQHRNWIGLDANAQFILIRQYFADWQREQPADLFIERIDTGATPTTPEENDERAKLTRLCDWLTNGGALWQRMSNGILAMEPNSIFVNDPGLSAERGGMRDQMYCLGNFRCAADEAILISIAPSPAAFWSAGLANRYWQSLDYCDRQSSLNSSQARADDGGGATLLITQDDPGFANWLDPCGLQTGTLAIRFLGCDAVTTPTIRRIRRSELQRCIGDTAPRMAPAQRNAVLAARRSAVLARFRR